MNKIYKMVLLLLVVALAACKKDNNTIAYKEKEVITVTGIDASYTKISNTDRITIDPTVTSSEAGADFDYLWGIYETNVQGSAPVLDTICKTKAIDYLIKQPAKGWVLVFRARNKKTGYAQYVSASVNVVTQYTRGWYVAKDDGSQTDLDLFLTPASIEPASKLENIYSSINGKKLDGTANIFSFITDYKTMVTGTLGNTRALFITSSRDASVVDINTLKEIHNFNGLFYSAPTTKAPDYVCIASQADYFQNDGQLYGIYSMSANTGQFGVRKLKDDQNTPYRLSKYFISYWISDPYFFDQTSSSFISANGSGTVMTSVSDDKTTEMKANNNNKTLLYMAEKSTSPYGGCAVFQDKTNPSLKIVSMITPSVSAFKMVNDTLKTTDHMYNATRFTALEGDENLLYFVVGNQLWSRNLSNKNEQLQFTAAAGEEINFIRHRKYTGTGAELPYSYNYVMVGTKSGGNYKVRMFTKTSGNLATMPSFTLEGTGSVGDVIYIAPLVSQTTYPNRF